MDIINQVVGYLASALLAFSLLVSNDLKFRWLNMFGCLFFIIYGILINAFPVLLTNAILLFINVIYLIKIYRRKEDFDLVEFDGDSKLVAKFLSYYSKDVHDYFPEFQLEKNESDIRFMVLRDMAIANIFVATITENGDGVVKINYTVPKYRDYKVGKFIFEKEKEFLLSRGLKRLVYYHVHNKGHEDFLQVMKFEKLDNKGANGYIKNLQ